MNNTASYQCYPLQLLWQNINQGKHFSLAGATLLHIAIVVFLLFSWTSSMPESAETKSIQIHMFQLPKPVVTKPALPAPQVKEAAPVKAIKQNKTIEKKDFAFKRIEKPKTKVEPKQKPELKPKAKVKKEPELVQQTVQAAPVKPAVKTEPGRPIPAAATASRQQAVQATSPARTEKAFDISQYHPIDKQAPGYPRKAIRKGIEGDCTVQYTVNKLGRVDNPKVIGQCHPGFVKPSLEAARTFRYAPRLINGVAVAVPNVRNTFEYRIN